MKTYLVTYQLNDPSCIDSDGKPEGMVTASRSDNYESYEDFLSFVIELAESGCQFLSASQIWEDGYSFDMTCQVLTDVPKMKKKMNKDKTTTFCDTCKVEVLTHEVASHIATEHIAKGL